MEERMDWMNIARYFYLTDERLQQISRDLQTTWNGPCRESRERPYQP